MKDHYQSTRPGLHEQLLPGLGLLLRGYRGVGLFFMLTALGFLLVLLWRHALVWSSLRSLGAGVLLLGLSPGEFSAVFTTDMLEFWVASLFLVMGVVALPPISASVLRRRMEEASTKSTGSSGIMAAGLRSFRKRGIGIAASVVVFFLYAAAFTAPLISPWNPYQQQDFLVTALRAPLTSIDALVLQEKKGITIPLRQGERLEDRLTNILIEDLQFLRSRGETHRVVFVDSYSIQDDTVIYNQGPREKTLHRHELATPDTPLQSVRSSLFLLGTDQYGRDILSRVIYGSRISLSIGFLVVLISVTLGTVIGVSSGYFGGIVDNVLMRIVDVLIAFPALFLILIIIATFGNSIFLIVVTLSFTGWMGVARIVRGQVLSLKEQEFILAARSLGLSHPRIILRHLVPNTLTPVIVAATLRIGSIILTEAGLSFLGLGVQPPTPSWGNIINEGRDSLLNHWWISTFPGIAILMTVICFNLIGDGVRDALDPRMRD